MKIKSIIFYLLVSLTLILCNIFTFPLFYTNFGLNTSTDYQIDLSDSKEKSEVIDYFLSEGIPFGFQYETEPYQVDVYYSNESLLNSKMKQSKHLSIGLYNYSFLKIEDSRDIIDPSNILTIYTNYNNLPFDPTSISQTTGGTYYFDSVIRTFVIFSILFTILELIILEVMQSFNSKRNLIYQIYGKKSYIFNDLKKTSFLYFSLQIFTFLLIIPLFVKEINLYNVSFIIIVFIQVILLLVLHCIILLLFNLSVRNKQILQRLGGKKSNVPSIYNFISFGLLLIITFNIQSILHSFETLHSTYNKAEYIQNNFEDYYYVIGANGPNVLQNYSKNSPDKEKLKSAYDNTTNTFTVSTTVAQNLLQEQYNDSCTIFSPAPNSLNLPPECIYSKNIEAYDTHQTYSEFFSAKNPILSVEEKPLSSYWVPLKYKPLGDTLALEMSKSDFVSDLKLNVFFPALYKIATFLLLLIIYFFFTAVHYSTYFERYKKIFSVKLLVGTSFTLLILENIVTLKKYYIFMVFFALLLNIPIYITIICILLDFAYTYIYLFTFIKHNITKEGL